MKKKKRLEEIFNMIQSYTMWDVVFSNDEFFEDLDTDYNKKEEKKEQWINIEKLKENKKEKEELEK